MKNITIDQLPLPGASVADVLDWNYLNQTASLDDLLGLLYNGIQALKVDLSYGEDKFWYISGSKTNVTSFLSTIDNYVEATDTDLYANLLLVLFQFDEGALNETSSIQNTNFTALIQQAIPSRYIYSLSEFLISGGFNETSLKSSTVDISWINLDKFLFGVKKRIIFGFLNGEKNVVSGANTLVFPPSIFNYVTDNTTIICPLSNREEIETVTQKQWRFLEGNFNSEQFLPYYECGYSPIITNNYGRSNYSELKTLVNSSILWTWNTSAPDAELSTTPSLSSASARYTAYRCGAVHQATKSYDNTWIMGNCYDRMPVLCSKSGQTYIWNITFDEHSYFTAGRKGVCPSGYDFSIPETPLQQRSIQLYMDENESSISAFWIDINSLATSNCWVTGWLSALCPYQKYDSTANLIIITAPTSIVAFFLLLVMFYFNWVRVPIQDNRNSWNRVINAYSKEEAEGVPS